MADQSYLSGVTFQDFLTILAGQHPFLLGMIDQSDPSAIAATIAQMNKASWEFEDTANGGRGVAYNLAQRIASNRSTGMTEVLKLFSPGGTIVPGPETIVLDALAGDAPDAATILGLGAIGLTVAYGGARLLAVGFQQLHAHR